MRLAKSLLAALMTMGLLSGAAAAREARHGDPALAARATISLNQARTIALTARPGRVTDWELEAEPGGSGLRYSFDIRSHSAAYEVGIDARDGRVLENAREGAHPD